jgi:2-amino-4-hydroxy-6-hydroxymethyldihydropteridine diphosphokinase
MAANSLQAQCAYIGLGANLGDAKATILHAIQKIAALANTQLSASSSLFVSAPIDADGSDYVNAVIQVKTTLSAHALLKCLQELELAFGRERPYHHAPRTLDLDLLLFGDEKICTEELTVPHPRMTERAFVLLPLLQLDPFIHIPGKGDAHQFAPAIAAQAIRKLV